MNMNPEIQKGTTPKAPTTRKPYESPRLQIYGGLGKVVETVANKSSVGDGGMGSFDKTA